MPQVPVRTVVRAAVVCVVAAGLVSACSSSTSGSGRAEPDRSSAAAPTSSSAGSSAPARATACVWGTSTNTLKQRDVTKPTTTTPPRSGTVRVSVATNRGAMTFTLDRAEAPCTVASFLSLVGQKYYDTTPCHRLTTAGIYVLQCGDPSGKGTGGPGYSVPDEATGKETYPAGTIAMARTSEPNSGGSQFFIVYKDSPSLMQNLGPLQYTVFGTVTSGLDVVTKVAAAGSDDANGQGDGAPKLRTEITRMTEAK